MFGRGALCESVSVLYKTRHSHRAPYLDLLIQFHRVVEAAVVEGKVEVDAGPGIIRLCYSDTHIFFVIVTVIIIILLLLRVMFE